MDSPTKIGSYEAKTHLPELLKSVRKGQEFMVTLRGKPVAELVPAGTSTNQDSGKAADDMEIFIRNRPPITDIDIKTLMRPDR